MAAGATVLEAASGIPIRKTHHRGEKEGTEEEHNQEKRSIIASEERSTVP